jgi:hypothetical protein
MYFYRANQYTFPTRFHVIHKYSLNIRKETCFLFLYDLIIKIAKNHGRSGKLWTIKRILSTYNVCDLVSSTVRKFIHSICCKMYMYEFHFTEIGNLFVSILRYSLKNFSPTTERKSLTVVKLRKRCGLSLLLNFS